MTRTTELLKGCRTLFRGNCNKICYCVEKLLCQSCKSELKGRLDVLKVRAIDKRNFITFLGLTGYKEELENEEKELQEISKEIKLIEKEI